MKSPGLSSHTCSLSCLPALRGDLRQRRGFHHSHTSSVDSRVPDQPAPRHCLEQAPRIHNFACSPSQTCSFPGGSSPRCAIKSLGVFPLPPLTVFVDQQIPGPTYNTSTPDSVQAVPSSLRGSSQLTAWIPLLPRLPASLLHPPPEHYFLNCPLMEFLNHNLLRASRHATVKSEGTGSRPA